MNVASVTLDEVLRAAARRAAALVPETAAYLALAIGDASARLPYRLDDDLVALTTEGTVRVARGRTVVAPDEGARVLRELLRRLLSVSAGSMPGLAAAAAPRVEVGGTDAVVAAIEAALIPVNRAAARRSLARLARDTARARDAGRLAGVVAPPPSPRPVATPVARIAPATPAAVPAAAAVLPAVAVELPLAADELEVLEPSPSVSIVVELADEPPPPDEPATPYRPELARSRGAVEPEELTHRIALPAPSAATPEPVAECAEDASLEGDEPEIHAEPTTIDAEVAPGPPAHEAAHDEAALDEAALDEAAHDEAGAAVATASDPDLAPLERAARSLEAALERGAIGAAAAPPRVAPAVPPPRRPWQAELAPAALSDVDALLARFQASEPATETRAMRRDLKHLVGIDATALPPRVADRTR